MDIGTNKEIDHKASTETEKYINGIRIHLVDIITPDKSYSVARFQKDAFKKLEEIQAEGKIPILVGGTGLYIDAIVSGYELTDENINETLRKELNSLSVNELQERLSLLSPESLNNMNNSDKNNPRRLIRAIERGEYNDRKAQPLETRKFSVEWHQPDYDKDELLTKIDVRVVDMISDGLIDEVENLLNSGYTKDDPGLKTMGYREVIQYLDHEITAPEMIGKIQTAHRQYAHRQITWFKKYTERRR
jgi:tRNA dimethylallyltransferase